MTAAWQTYDAEAAVPRSTSGARMRTFDGQTYCVAIDSEGTEVSARHSGTLWWSIASPGEGDKSIELDVIFADDEFGGTNSTFTINRRPSGTVSLWAYLDDERLLELDGTYSGLAVGSMITHDWSRAFGNMA